MRVPRIQEAAANQRRGESGFTLVELLVVIAIIGVLVSLLLPAVQAAREAARMSQCQNNLRQVALAALNYESARGELPPGCIAYADDEDRRNVGPGWAILILPYMEQNSIYQAFDFSGKKSYRDSRNVAASQTRIGPYMCPTDTFADELVQPQGEPGRFAPTTYKSVGGVLDQTRSAGSPVYWGRRYANSAIVDQFSQLRGAMPATGPGYALQPTRMSQITDGTTATAMVGEYHTATLADIRKSVWGSGWRYHSKGLMIRGSLYRTPDMEQCINLSSQVAGSEGPFICFRAFASLHAGGMMNFALCDGSVQGLNENIDDEVYLLYGSIDGGLDNGPINGAAPGPPPPPPPPR